MAEEFTINSSAIETKINQLLPSQGGFAPGVDFSASTMVIPIVDLTESAEGGAQREDLQKAFTLVNTITYDISNTTTTIANTPGFYRIVGNVSSRETGSGATALIQITDGVTTKIIVYNRLNAADGTTAFQSTPISYDLIVKLEAGDTLQGTSNNAVCDVKGIARQIADVSGNLVNP